MNEEKQTDQTLYIRVIIVINSRVALTNRSAKSQLKGGGDPGLAILL